MKSLSLLTAMSLLALAAAFAQSNEAAGAKRAAENMFYMQVPGPGPMEHTFDFIASEFHFEGATVKNAPYSAEAVTEVTQRLADGNRISRKTSANMYRDSEGRTRREENLGAIGPWASNAEPSQTIFINDPVANTNLVLDTRNKIARKMPAPKIRMATGPNGPGGAAVAGIAVADMKGNFERHVSIRQGGAGEPGMFISGAPMQIPLGRDLKKDAQEESLGSQMIEGVRADGTRTTITIPAGAIGNEQPMKIVSERWYSPELQTVVMTKRSDPRMGDTTYRLTSIDRSEPARSLFEAPADYTVTDGKPFLVKSKD